eukprot:GSA25T00004963001.1
MTQTVSAVSCLIHAAQQDYPAHVQQAQEEYLAETGCFIGDKHAGSEELASPVGTGSVATPRRPSGDGGGFSASSMLSNNLVAGGGSSSSSGANLPPLQLLSSSSNANAHKTRNVPGTTPTSIAAANSPRKSIIGGQDSDALWDHQSCQKTPRTPEDCAGKLTEQAGGMTGDRNSVALRASTSVASQHSQHVHFADEDVQKNEADEIRETTALLVGVDGETTPSKCFGIKKQATNHALDQDQTETPSSTQGEATTPKTVVRREPSKFSMYATYMAGMSRKSKRLQALVNDKNTESIFPARLFFPLMGWIGLLVGERILAISADMSMSWWSAADDTPAAPAGEVPPISVS